MQLTTLLIPTYTQMLKTLSGWLKRLFAFKGVEKI